MNTRIQELTSSDADGALSAPAPGSRVWSDSPVPAVRRGIILAWAVMGSTSSDCVWVGVALLQGDRPKGPSTHAPGLQGTRAGMVLGCPHLVYIGKPMFVHPHVLHNGLVIQDFVTGFSGDGVSCHIFQWGSQGGVRDRLTLH